MTTFRQMVEDVLQERFIPAGEADPELGSQWDAYIAAHKEDPEYIQKVIGDEKLKAAYMAVMNASTIPSKRKALRDFFQAYPL